MVVGIPELFVVLAICALSLIVIWPSAQIARRLGFSPLPAEWPASARR